MLRGTTHPTNDEEFYPLFVTNLMYVLKRHPFKAFFSPKRIQELAIHRTLFDFGYVQDANGVWVYDRKGFKIKISSKIITDAPEVAASKIASAGQIMSSQNIELPNWPPKHV